MAGETLRAFRQRRGWTQKKMAEELGVTTEHVCRVENGVRILSKPMERMLTLLQDKHERAES